MNVQPLPLFGWHISLQTVVEWEFAHPLHLVLQIQVLSVYCQQITWVGSRIKRYAALPHKQLVVQGREKERGSLAFLLTDSSLLIATSFVLQHKQLYLDGWIQPCTFPYQQNPVCFWSFRCSFSLLLTFHNSFLPIYYFFSPVCPLISSPPFFKCCWHCSICFKGLTGRRLGYQSSCRNPSTGWLVLLTLRKQLESQRQDETERHTIQKED